MSVPRGPMPDPIPPVAIAKVLLVEDSAIYAERMREALVELSCIELVNVVDSEQAAIASIYRWAVDVIILDLQLREGSGFGVLRALAAMPRRPRVIVLTNHDLEEYQTAAVALGASHFLDKARDADRLPQILRELARAASRH